MPDRLVYSTDGGRVSNCPVCGQPYKHCRCDQSPAETPSSSSPIHRGTGIVRVMRDRKHRGGKTVTVIAGVPGNESEMATLAQRLKKLCGSGGTVKDGNIEIQGDHCVKVQAKLAELGYKVKRAGG
jgi:translation initiation factor 1